MNDKPQDWKNYEDFAAGIDTNRLPATDALAGRALTFELPSGAFAAHFVDGHTLAWRRGDAGDTDWYEAIEVAPDTFFVDVTFRSRPAEALTLVFNTATRRVLGILSRIRSREEAGAAPRVAQEFLAGTLASGDAGEGASGAVPAETRDLIGTRTLNVYSPNHTYEHTYLSSTRYCWQCLVGEQRGHGDVDLATTYKFADDLYVFTFREFLIPVASVFVFNFAAGRSTGKFLGETGDGAIANRPAGSFIRKLSQAVYPADAQPV
ncbi:molybdenum cofactor biosynthesis F family protein [Burkholderia thailandensis]|uniref:Molybdenum cofactor biosynthesis F family protein n=1 Tax=Burkholderia thailandensis TaxID=57975 RepID=A0AAW9CZX3_BURTH|nr:molybdenum cofactor biosynthesis F family protein [Burkholderia thailandensis]AHI64351.1 molybdenum cofactor biosynthesis F family protein [Burkholderia thailandensis H0587]AIP62243.1 molybdenum cofactor biosynthesis protein F [Burkholderia thailandensis]AOI50362.1 molybdenum cofactor biosynthesis protein F [Burkholderia thailandensis]AOJ49402.1 molybdenum cofactor biosynthesis protein F [Burkholderia thailandensis]AVR24765.1 molybdenum cofactor biosynthesis protein F [Burkholderia thailand